MGAPSAKFARDGVDEGIASDYSRWPRTRRHGRAYTYVWQNLVGLAVVVDGAGTGSEMVAGSSLSVGG